jgi:hypothetical protein
MGEYRWVEIVAVDMQEGECASWYRIGQRYFAKPYRHNPDGFLEIKGWNGKVNSFAGDGSDKDNTNHQFWIVRRHVKEIIIPSIEEHLFVIE